MKYFCFSLFFVGFLTTAVAALVQRQECRSSIPFAIDRSLTLTPQQFKAMNNFVVNPFLSQLFPQDIRPNYYATFSQGAFVRYDAKAVSDIVKFINSPENVQNHEKDSYFLFPMSGLLFDNVLNISAAAHLPQNLVVFTGGQLHDIYFNDVQKDVKELTANRNTVTVVFVKPNVNQTNYKRIPLLKLVEWSNDAKVLLANILKNMNCREKVSTASSKTTQHPVKTTVHTSKSTPHSVKTTIHQAKTTAHLIKTTKHSSVKTTPSPTDFCESHIPFAYDVSKSLTSEQYNLEKQLVLDFLSTLFSTDDQPSWFGIFDTLTYFPKSRPKNVSDIVSFVNLYPQFSGNFGNLDQIMKQLLERKIFAETDDRPVNTVIFTGSELPSANIEDTINYGKRFTGANNTLTFVFTKPNISQKNYNAAANIINLALIQYNKDNHQLVAHIRQAMKCP